MTLQLFKLIKADRKAFFGTLLTKNAIENAGDAQGCLEAINKKALKGMNKAQKVELFNQLTEQVKPEMEDDYDFYFTFTLPERNYALVAEGFTLDGFLAEAAEKQAEADLVKAEKQAERSRIAQAQKAERDALKAEFKKEQEEIARLEQLEQDRLARIERQEQEHLEEQQRKAQALATVGACATAFFAPILMGIVGGVAKGATSAVASVGKDIGKGIKKSARTSRRNSLKARKANMMAMGGASALMAKQIKIR